jgi:DNA-binding SARP family transcriptional activator/tetratricopeptide (TPR) repeat protein
VAVLARLLLSPGQVVSMDQLVDSVWDGDAPTRPEVAVRSYLSNLRRSIEPARDRGDRRSCIESRSPGYRLVVDPTQVDAVRFEQLVVDGRRALISGDPETAVELLGDACRLWRGEPCAGVLETTVIATYRTRLIELCLGATEAMFEARLQLGEYDAVIPDLEEAVARHPLRERMSELSMRALYAAGRQSDALAVFRQLRRRLVDEFGVDPGPRIQDLEHKILTHDPSLTPTGRASTTVAGSPTRQDRLGAAADPNRWPVLGPASDMVGRDRETTALLAVQAELAQGRSRSALITGEPGSGKTTLVQEMTHRLGASGAVVAWGRCRAVARGRVLWPWSQLLDDLATEVDVDVDLVTGLEPVFALSSNLATRAGGGALPPVAPPGSEAEALAWFQPVVELLRRISARRNLVLVVDDAHWADRVSVELLSYVGASLASAPVGIVATWRDTEPLEHSSRRALRELCRLPGAVRIELGGIDVRAAEELVTRRGGDPELARRFHWASAGNPLLIRQLLDGATGLTGAAGARGDPVGSSSHWPFDHEVLPAPSSSLCDVILDRVDRVHRQAGEVLAVAALAARSFSATVVAEAGGFSALVVDDVLDGAVDAGLLVGGPDRAYLFVHPISQAVLAGALPEPRRSRLHAALGQAMWRTGSPAADLAYHFARAGSAGTSILAARFALEASTGLVDPAELSVAATAAAQGLAALDHLDRVDGLDAELAILLTHLARLQGDVDRFHHMGARAVAAARRYGGGRQLVHAVLAVTGADPGSPGPGGVEFLGHRPDPDLALEPVIQLLEELDTGHPARPVLELRRRALLALAGRGGAPDLPTIVGRADPVPAVGMEVSEVVGFAAVEALPSGPAGPAAGRHEGVGSGEGPSGGPDGTTEPSDGGEAERAPGRAEDLPAESGIPAGPPGAVMALADVGPATPAPGGPVASKASHRGHWAGGTVDLLAVDIEQARLAESRWPAEVRLELAERVDRRAIATGRRRAALVAARLRLHAHLEQGSVAAAVQALEEARATLRPDDGLSRLELETLEIDLALLQGRLADADSGIAAGRRRCRAAGLAFAAFDRRLAALRWINGDLDQAEQLLRAVHAGPGGADEIDRLVTGVALAADRGDREAASEGLDAFLTTEHWPRSITDHSHLERAALVAQAAEICGHRPAARAVLGLLADHATVLVTTDRGTVAPGPVAYYAAQAALALGYLDQARDLLDEAERRCRGMQARTCLVKTLVAQAGMAARPALGDDQADGPLVIDLDLDPQAVELDLRSVIEGPLAEARELADEIARSWTPVADRRGRRQPVTSERDSNAV